MIEWSDGATADVAGALNWLNERNPAAAEQIVEDVLAAVQRLEAFPSSGRLGRRAGTRELVVRGRPYIVIYKLCNADVVILRVLHAAQRWPLPGDG